MQELINEYRQSLREFKNSKVDTYKAGMIGDTQFAIEYMETGRMPGAKWTVARWNREDREIPFDNDTIGYVFESNQPMPWDRSMLFFFSAPKSKDNVFDQIEELLHTLSEREKEVYKMVHGELFSLEQTAKILGLTKTTVQTYLMRAERKLYKARL